ncbi:beta-N-acetylglucosaminidase domain-containing protein [Anaerococcus sp.]|uniref:beta-N-acetylglucosaminidase domain-containing protein n=1 Tax=Anaerococcus sp. TaxID=1872515 RepID=UPI0027B997E6|nr:beta-N-acetylglucosaminidase domain-containing protein [Anaerococcus sp.]
MNKMKLNKVVLLVIMICTFAIFAKSSLASGQDYEIYPKVHEIEYQEGNASLNGQVNLVLADKLDKYTKEKAENVLKNNGINYTVSSKEQAGTNILVGIKGSDDQADKYFKQNAVDKDIYGHFDAYCLSVKDKTIAIVGKDTDASFYGLETLDLILRQANKEVRNLVINDYSSVKFRGAIEGFYGNPWGWDNRIDNLKFGGQFKNNIFVFAPKDDPYHNQKWRDLYPKEDIDNIRKLAEVGNENKNRFVWTIHPFMNNPLTSANADEDIPKIINKFEQLYQAGVRQYGVLADDIQGTNRDVVVRLMNELSEWAKDKGDVYDLLFCPTSYTLSWNWNASELNKWDREFPDNVQIFFTGSSTMSYINESDLQKFKTRGTLGKERRSPLFWLNWSVNDIDKSFRRVFIGPMEMVSNDAKSMIGVVTNPMEHAHLSQLSLFAMADYTWNVEDFDAQQSWYDSFKYVEENATEELRNFAKHNTSSDGVGYSLKESEELLPFIKEFEDAVDKQDKDAIKEKGDKLKAEYQKIADNVDDYNEKAANEAIKDELKPYLESMKDTSLAAIKDIEAIEYYAQKGGDKNLVQIFKEADAMWKKANAHTFNSRGKELPIRTGSKRIRANVEKMHEILSEVAIDPNAKTGPFKNPNISEENIITSASYGIYQNHSKKKMIDLNDNSFTWWSTPGDTYRKGDYIGFDLKEEYPLGRFRLVMGGSSANDHFSEYEIVYSNDKVNWKRYGDPITQKEAKKVTEIDFSDEGITARYVAVRSLTEGHYWVQVSNMMVKTLDVKEADKTSLNEMIKYSESIKKEEYNSESFDRLAKKLEEAKKVSSRKLSSQEEVDKVYEELMDSVFSLEELEESEVDKERLEILIKASQDVVENENKYEENTAAEVKEALTSALEVNKNKNTSQEEVDEAYNNLSNKLLALRKKDSTSIDKSRLKTLLDSIGTHESDKYTNESIEIYKQALDKAKEVFKNTTAKQEEVDDCYESLLEAILDLELK